MSHPRTAHRTDIGKPARRAASRRSSPSLTRVTGRQAQQVLAALGPYRAMLEPQRQHLLSLYRPDRRGVQGGGHRAPWARATTASTSKATAPTIRCFCRSRKSLRPATRPTCPTRIPPHHNGQRVVEGQRAMQVQSDPFLGWTHMGGRDYLVRQLNDHKGSIAIEDLAGEGPGGVRGSLRRVAGPRPCALRRSAHDRRLHRHRQPLRASAGASSASPTPIRRKRIGRNCGESGTGTGSREQKGRVSCRTFSALATLANPLQ